MIFVGKYDFSVDPQGRISFPGEWRTLPDDFGWVILPESDRALLLMPESGFLDFFYALQKLTLSDPELRLAAARVGAEAKQGHCDRQGRLTLPKNMLESCGVTKAVTLIGAVTHIRVCAPEKWDPAKIDSALSSAIRRIGKLADDRGALEMLIEGVMDK